MKKFVVSFILALSLGTFANAQKVAVGTNILDWANMLTVNANVDYSFARHFTLDGEVRWNGFAYHDPKIMHRVLQNCKFEVAAGVRYWPWYVFSGLNIGGKLYYKDYCNSGMYTHNMEKGKLAAAAVTLGYSIMITKSINIEVGVGGFAGYDFDYHRYDCPVCLNPVDDNGNVLLSDVARPRWSYGLENVYLTFYYILK